MLLALTAKLFDEVPLDRMTDAEQAVREAVADIPVEVSARIEAAGNLSDGDRELVMRIARNALALFLPAPELEPESTAEEDKA